MAGAGEAPTFLEHDVSSARVAVLMLSSECDRMRRILLAGETPPSRGAVLSLLRVDTVRLNHYRDIFKSGVRIEAGMVQEMWRNAVQPVLGDTQLYACHPALRCSFLNRAYQAYRTLYDEVPQYQHAFTRCLRDLARALSRASREALDQAMEQYAAPECADDTIVHVAKSYINVQRWQQAKETWKLEIRTNAMLEASLHSLREVCASDFEPSPPSSRSGTPAAT